MSISIRSRSKSVQSLSPSISKTRLRSKSVPSRYTSRCRFANINLLGIGTYGCVISNPINNKNFIIEEYIPYCDIDINDIYTYIDRNQHKKLWELYAEYSLLKMDFNSAEKAMIQYNDYMGLNFIKRIKSIDDDNIKRAEIYQFFLDYDKAEETYSNIDRKDLSILMRIKLGNWEKVIDLIKESGYVQEDNLKMAKNNLGLQNLEKKEYKKAEELFLETNNYEGLINTYFKSENYDKTIPLIESIPENNEFLNFMAEKFETVKKFFHFFLQNFLKKNKINSMDYVKKQLNAILNMVMLKKL